jgi:uracil-DNA glycosylase family 4
MADYQRYKPREELPTFQPPGEYPAPRQINKTQRYKDVLYVTGRGPKPAKIMFLMPALTEDDAQESMATRFAPIAVPAMYMKSTAGGLFKNLLEEVGLPPQEQYFSAVCKWLLPKAQRGRPKAAALEWAQEALDNEIKAVKPEIIVCLGKSVFDLFFPIKLKLAEIAGGWFRSEEYGCRIYPMDDIQKPLLKPEYLEKFRVDLLEVRKMLDLCNGIETPKVEQKYQVIRNSADLLQLVTKLFTEQRTLLSVDCEWGGLHHVDGQLRSLQVCWAPGEAAYVRFRGEDGNYALDVDYKVAGQILGMWFNQPQVKFIGHQLTADMAWMSHTLGLEIYQKAAWDTLYAMQCIDENQEAKLERLALAYTDLGRYDVDLVIWKKTNKVDDDEGYARIPDDIIIPYACRDTDAVMRIYPQQLRQMAAQGPGLINYYLNLFLPFVTDIFCNFTLVGLPMDLERLTKLRAMYICARDRLNALFLTRITEESRRILLTRLSGIEPMGGIVAFQAIDAAIKENETEKAMSVLKDFVKVERLSEFLPVYEHFIDAPTFNIRSVAQMKRWLFDVKGFTPLKSTGNKEKGTPSMSWDKVMALPEAARLEIQPSCDKQTLKVLAEKDDLVNELLGLNAVGNLTKAFLRPAEIDDEGNLVRENGLHYWVASDGRVHGQFATTETGRPRSWKPNSLNWPSWVTDQISKAIARLVEKEAEDSEFRQLFRALTGEARDEDGKLVPPPSLRSSISAQSIPVENDEDGWCIVESDYQTAEVLGLAYISGDPALIKLMTEDDLQFGALKGGNLEKDRVRLCYDPNYKIAPEHQNPDFIMTVHKGGKVVRRLTEDDLHRRPDGSLWHPKHDLHWNLIEMIMHKPREMLHKKKHRDGIGKVGNFKSAYGSSSDSMERAIEADTGVKPEPGMGQAILDALAARQPVADAFLKAQELVPDNEHKQVAASGRIRHYRTHDVMSSVGKRVRDKVLSALGREARNFYMQTSVADTASRAAVNLTATYRAFGMDARVIAVLYDSVVTLCRKKERFAVKELHQLYMCDLNGWNYHGRTLKYPIDTEFNYRWSCRPSKDEQKLLDCPTWQADQSLTEKINNYANEARLDKAA